MMLVYLIIHFNSRLHRGNFQRPQFCGMGPSSTKSLGAGVKGQYLCHLLFVCHSFIPFLQWSGEDFDVL